jgi:hypothetical protein
MNRRTGVNHQSFGGKALNFPERLVVTPPVLRDGGGGTVSDLSFTGDGDRVAVQASVGGDGYTGPSTFTFTVREAQIQLMRITA